MNPAERSLKEGNSIVRTLGKKIADELAGVDKIASGFKVPRDEEKDTPLISSVKELDNFTSQLSAGNLMARNL